MRLASDRVLLSKAKPEALYRLAAWLGLKFRHRCKHPQCIHDLVERLARKMIER